MSEQTIEIEAETLKETREQVKSKIPDGLSLLSEIVISDGKPKTVRAVAYTTEAAFAKAQSEIPTDAIVVEKKKLHLPAQKTVGIEAFDEKSARSQVESQIGKTATIKTLRLATAGRKGFLGIGKTPNQYQAEVFQQAVVRVTYKTKAKISVTFGERKAQVKKKSTTVVGDSNAEWIEKPLRCPKCRTKLNDKTPRFGYVRCSNCGASFTIRYGNVE